MIALDSFKDCMTSKEAASIMEKAVNSVDINIETIKLPVADGGEGTLEALTHGANDSITYKEEVTGPLGEPVIAKFTIMSSTKTAVVEMAEARSLGQKCT